MRMMVQNHTMEVTSNFDKFLFLLSLQCLQHETFFVCIKNQRNSLREINFAFPQLWLGRESILGFTGKAFACELAGLDLCTHDALSVKPKKID